MFSKYTCSAYICRIIFLHTDNIIFLSRIICFFDFGSMSSFFNRSRSKFWLLWLILTGIFFSCPILDSFKKSWFFFYLFYGDIKAIIEVRVFITFHLDSTKCLTLIVSNSFKCFSSIYYWGMIYFSFFLSSNIKGFSMVCIVFSKYFTQFRFLKN